MIQLAKYSECKPEDLSLIPRIHIRVRKKKSPLRACAGYMYPHPHRSHIIIVTTINVFKLAFEQVSEIVMKIRFI